MPSSASASSHTASTSSPMTPAMQDVATAMHAGWYVSAVYRSASRSRSVPPKMQSFSRRWDESSGTPSSHSFRPSPIMRNWLPPSMVEAICAHPFGL